MKSTTNIEKYADKYANRTGSWDFAPAYNSVYKDDYLIRNFTLAEIKELRRTQRYADRNHDMDDLF
jgi:hypothetical protein